MCYVYLINFCKEKKNTYINFESISSVTYFFHVRILDPFFSFFHNLFLCCCFLLLVYSLNLALCLHLAINSHLLFNNFSGTEYFIICIFSSKHKLHLPSKRFGVFDFFNIDH